MKIDFMVTKDILNGGGIEHFTRQVGKRLVERGHEVTVYSIDGAERGPDCLDGMRVRWVPRVDTHWAEKLAGSVCAARLHFRQPAPDIVHLHSVAAGAISSLLHHRRIPCVVQMHGIEWQRSRWPLFGRAVLKQLERISIRYADALTAVSRVQCEYYSKTFGRPVRFIPTAAEIKRLADPQLILNQPFRPNRYILSASRLVPEKGIHYLISAFRELKTAWHLVIAGDDGGTGDYGRQLRSLAGEDERIHFLGFVKGQLLDELFSNAGVYVQPSEIEGLAIALLEGMSFALPCVVSDIPENLEAIGNAGITFETKNVRNLRDRLALILENSDMRAELGTLARERVAKLYNWDTVTEALESLYSDALSKITANPARARAARAAD